MSEDLSQGGSYLSPDVWALGGWVELKVSPGSFSEDTARSPETVAAWRMFAQAAKALAELGRTLFEAFQSMLDKIAEAFQAFGFLADDVLAYAGSTHPDPPQIRAVHFRRLDKVRSASAYDRRPVFGALGGREGHRHR